MDKHLHQGKREYINDVSKKFKLSARAWRMFLDKDSNNTPLTH